MESFLAYLVESSYEYNPWPTICSWFIYLGYDSLKGVRDGSFPSSIGYSSNKLTAFHKGEVGM